MDQYDVHPASIDPQELLAQCEVRRLRRSGPGGQRRNKVETAVILRHRPTDIAAEANERRSPAENQTVALLRLRLKMALEIRVARTPEQIPSPLLRRRSHGGRISVSPSHDDFPAVLAEVLDVLAICQSDMSRAAELLGCTSSQLVKLLKKEPHAIAQVNRQRQALGLRTLQ